MLRCTLLVLLCGCAPALAANAYTQIGATASAQGLTGNSQAWQSQSIDWQRRSDTGTAYYAALGRDSRFGLDDNYISGGLHLPLAKRWSLDTELRYSPDYHFLPHESVFAGANYALSDRWILHAGWRHARYADSNVNVATLGAEAYLGAWRLAYTLYEGTNSGASGASHLVQADWYYGDISHIGLGLIHGREVERIDPTRIVVTPVNGVFLSGTHAITPHWSFNYTLGITSLQDFYTRREISLGVAYRY